MRRATKIRYVAPDVSFISIHALLAESDCGCCARCRYWGYFYPRSPCGERLYVSYNMYNATNHFYPRSPCGERRYKRIIPPRYTPISIHALLAESDRLPLCTCPPLRNISIHALLAESDSGGSGVPLLPIEFLSTLSLRRATCSPRTGFCRPRYFYPRSPCGERRRTAANRRPIFFISIHALLAESDVNGDAQSSCFVNFYPRSPCGERQ